MGIILSPAVFSVLLTLGYFVGSKRERDYYRSSIQR